MYSQELHQQFSYFSKIRLQLERKDTKTLCDTFALLGENMTVRGAGTARGMIMDILEDRKPFSYEMWIASRIPDRQMFTEFFEN